MPQGAGRPLKYAFLLIALEDQEIYSPAGIALFGERTGLLDTTMDKDDVLLQRLRIRHTMARYRVNHAFPECGDGIVIMKGQSVALGWYGRRWKEKAMMEAMEAAGETVYE